MKLKFVFLLMLITLFIILICIETYILGFSDGYQLGIQDCELSFPIKEFL